MGWPAKATNVAVVGNDRDERRQELTLLQRGDSPRSGLSEDAAARSGHASGVGKGETFHHLLSLDSSILNRGRGARRRLGIGATGDPR